MDRSTERGTNSSPIAFDRLPAMPISPLDPQESFDLHRAINERRAQVENAEMLRRARSL